MSSVASIKRKIFAWLRLARISNAPTVVTNVMAGAAVAGGPFFPDHLISLSAAMVLFYIAGMFLNDLCDLDVDRRDRPERPLPSALLSPWAVLGATLLFFILGLELLWPMGDRVFSLGLVLILLIIAYNLWHKRNPLSPLLTALCRGVVYAIAFFSLSFRSTPFFFAVAGGMTLYGLGVSLLARREIVHPGLGRFIGPLIAGISLYDAAVLAVAGHYTGAGFAVVMFALALWLQRFVRGT